MVDIVAFVSRGDFPRSRLGEKQRGKILASWVTRKMRTIAQFGIKDPAGADPDAAELAFARRSGHSFRSGSVRGGSSLKHVESGSALADLEEKDYAPLPTGVSEMPADDDSIMQSPPSNSTEEWSGGVGEATPTGMHPMRGASLSYPSAVEMPAEDMTIGEAVSDERPSPPPRHDDRALPFLNLPSVDGRGSLMGIDDQGFDGRSSSSGGGGGLKIANQTSSDGEHEWPTEALMHMNLSSKKSR